MGINFNLYKENGKVILDLNTKPINSKVIPINMTSQPSYNTGYESDWTFIDPETKIKTRNNSWLLSESAVQDGKCPAYRLVNNIAVAIDVVSLYSPCRLGSHNPSQPTVGVQTMIDMTTYIPTANLPNDFLRAYDQNGVLSWSLNSLANSVQLIEKRTFNFSSTDTYANKTMYIDIPDNIDISKVFVCPIANGLPYASDSGISSAFSARYIIVKRVNRRFYFTLTFHMYFNTYVQNSCDNINNKLTITGYNAFTVAIFYLPNPPP